MTKRSAGFTLIELMIVVAIIAIIASIAIPNLLAARISSNESAAIATMKNLVSAQAQLRASAVIDGNGNGAGEYGYFQELSGTRNVKTGTPPAVTQGALRLSPPLLSPSFGEVQNVGGYGCAIRSGYYFIMCLPDQSVFWTPEPAASAAYPQVDPAQAEVHWAAYAWPLSYGNSGKRIFFVNQAGDVMQASNATTRYSGTGNVPNLLGVLQASATNKTSMSHSIAVNATGNDGNFWTAVN